MRQLTNIGLEALKKHEALRLTRYLDSAGLPTIGWGHLILKGEKYQKITRAGATALLRIDAGIAERAVARYICVPLTDGQFDALVIFTFNVGTGALQSSTLRQKINRYDHAAAPAQFMRWVYAGGRRIRGLVNRRRTTAAMYAAATL